MRYHPPEDVVSSPGSFDDSSTHVASVKSVDVKVLLKDLPCLPGLSTGEDDKVLQSVPSTSTRTNSEPTPILPIHRVVKSGGICDRFQVCRRLWNICRSVHNAKSLPPEFFQDLVEIQRTDKDLYADIERCKAWSLLRDLATKKYTREIASALLRVPPHVAVVFIRSLALHQTKDPDPFFSPLCSVVWTIQDEHPEIFHDAFGLDDFCAVITPNNLSPHPHSLHHFFNSLAAFSQNISRDGVHDETCAASYPDHEETYPIDGAHSHHSCWDLPPFAQCLLQFLLRGGEADVLKVVDHIITFITPFAQEFPNPKDINDAILHQPLVMKGDLHPTRPFLLFALHLAYHSELAARTFIGRGVLHSIGRLWVYDFCDPRGVGSRGAEVQNDMRVACLLFLGALTRHYPSAREMANHLLSLMVNTSNTDGDNPPRLHIGGLGSLCHYKALFTATTLCRLGASCALPTLTLFYMEMCLTHGVQVPEMVAWKYGEPWTAIIHIISSPLVSVSLRDAAARTLFTLASAPDAQWEGFTRVLFRLPVTYAQILSDMFQYITQTFLCVNSNPLPNGMRQVNLDCLRKLSANAGSRGSETANAVERFVLLIRVRQATNRIKFSSMLAACGMPDLLRAVMNGKYEFLTGKPSEVQVRARERVCSRMLAEMKFAEVQEEQWRQQQTFPVATPPAWESFRMSLDVKGMSLI
ncbi:hypothetical protein BXZ70DRAFT_961694 [Cristinia sonorae]|uniref:Uncharacterized protein n=1 Tax=Cristinia sonorae TaxID=1940300 RepID=A0A8K0UEX6_9AGAR|nr:hypothetical protein BXZ70DRAFT_961694 [Cristinia sonorae]